MKAALFSCLLGIVGSLNANAGTLQANPNPRNFGNVVLGVNSTSTVVVTNSGSTTSITGITVTGSANFGASSCASLPVVLADGASCVLSVSFRPTSAGAKTATIVVSNDAGEPLNITLQGTGTQQIALLSPGSLQFVKQALGTTSAVKSLTLTNAGSAGSILSIASITVSGANAGDFVMQGGTGACTAPGGSLASGASCTIGIAFAPSAAGVRTASVTVTTNDPITPTRTASLSGGGAGMRGDFNGDGRADVLWRNVATGQNYLYPLNGTTILADEGYLRTVADFTWTMAGIGDFDGDGKADIFWRNTSTGQTYIYFMNGRVIEREGYMRTVADQAWQVAGIGDFDGDGRADILWRNSATGSNYVYLMNGLQIAGEGYLPNVDQQSWRVVGIGDFDGDGKDDLLWRRTNDGSNYIYLMNGIGIKHQTSIRSVAGPWNVMGVRDFNGDGKADILWRNFSTGENYLFPMNGTQILISEGYLRTVSDQSWRIVQVGDFDGDGKADILWRNVTTGQNYVYPMDGRFIKASEGFIRTVNDPSWLVFSDTPSNPRPPGSQLVINEVDYDSVGADTGEFIELHNPTDTHIPTINLAVVLVADGREYARINLGSTSVPPRGYLVIGNAAVLAGLPAGTLSIPIPDDTVHNGANGGIALFDSATNTLVDSLSYEDFDGLNTAAVIDGAPGTYNLIEGGMLLRGTAFDKDFIRFSVIRYPNGRDTNNTFQDWTGTSTPTPGLANLP